MSDTPTTAHIPDEAVQAAKKAVFERCKKTYLTDDQMFAALTSALPHLSAPCAVEVPTKEERHANTSRNLIINQTSTDLEQIINGHDPEQSILNNDVWDRLDKMACEIEALTKPVDVAAVRRQAFEEIIRIIDVFERDFEQKWRDQLKSEIRALSAEPALGDQWQPIETAPNSEMLLLACADWPLVKCGREVPVNVGHKSFGRWTVFGASWTPTHWMPLPAAPNTEAGK
ncbi:DUF551 domain-containing protein [Ochrobactrum sp. SFR4]|uniref:DUF551 domain-containing protein n=1 Tax=Ochrobactrum sp. SFR4 TaxID=2717368 RepID=UPI001C8BFF33|nr:DUF551 domain-containing protein [Ochrobactrum sp. SFR4]MBX8824719.1 DUF551 domain-containing protein [Ochrobactrum sp. SFR4]